MIFLRRLLRAAVAVGCRTSGALARCERRDFGKLLIVCYHRILPFAQKRRYALPDLAVTPESFHEHCKTFRRFFDVLPLSDARAAQKHAHGRDRLLAITFDDGYHDNYRYAAPILSEVGVRGTFFPVTDYIGRKEMLWFDRLAETVNRLERTCDGVAALVQAGLRDVCLELSRRTPADAALRVVRYARGLSRERRDQLMVDLGNGASTQALTGEDDRVMNWTELAELANAGHEIGSHGRCHPALTRLDDRDLRSEVEDSRKVLGERLGRDIRSFCYPAGDWDERVRSAVCAAGYDCAVTVQSGANDAQSDPFALRRWFIHEDRLMGMGGRAFPALLRMELSGLANRMFRRDGRRNAR